MLAWRLILGPILIAAMIGVFALDAKAGSAAPYLLVLSLALAARSVHELVLLTKVRSFEPWLPGLAIASLAIVASNWWGRFGFLGTARSDEVGLTIPMLVLSLCAMFVFARAAARYESPGKSVETVGVELLILCYVGVFLSATLQLRWVGESLGYFPLASLIVAVKCGDTSAYTFGRLFGRAKLVPLLSPGKTWAGAYGALGGATLGTLAWFHWGGPWCAPNVTFGHWLWIALYGVILGLVGLIGDLCESLIKRDVGQKDSAPLLPGFGGLLDLLDSIIYSGPAAYLLWRLLPLAEVTSAGG